MLRPMLDYAGGSASGPVGKQAGSRFPFKSRKRKPILCPRSAKTQTCQRRLLLLFCPTAHYLTTLLPYLSESAYLVFFSFHMEQDHCP